MISGNGKIIFLLLLAVLEIKSCKREDFKYVKIVEKQTAFEHSRTQELTTRDYEKYQLILPIEGSSDCDAKIEEYEENLEDAYVVDLRGHLVSELRSGDVQNLEHLQYLTLSSNGIEVIQPGTFLNLPAIHKMKLDNNKLKEISSGVFNDLQTETLELNNNNIVHIAPDAFNNMQKLKYMNLENNQLTKIPNGFGNLKSLEVLKLASNQIEIFDDVTLTQLGELTLDRNKFECLSDKVLASFSKKLKLNVAPNKGITCSCWNKIQEWQSDNYGSNEKTIEATIRHSDLRCRTEMMEVLLNINKKV